MMIVSGTWDEVPPEEPGIYVIALAGAVIEIAVISVVDGKTYIRSAHCSSCTRLLSEWMNLIRNNEGYCTTFGCSDPQRIVRADGDKVKYKTKNPLTPLPLQWYRVELPPTCYKPKTTKKRNDTA